MKKIIAIVGVNLLIAGGLGARAGWMIMSGCDIDGTCRGTSNMLTWGLAIGPILLMLVVLGLSVPRLMASMSERRAEKREMKAEKAAVAASFAAEAEQGQNRLARLKRPVADEQAVDDELELAADSTESDWPADVAPLAAVPAAQEAGLAADVAADSLPVLPAIDDDEADAIEREWQAAEAALDPARTGFMAEPAPDGSIPADLPPTFAPASVPLTDLPPYQLTETDQADFRLTPLAFDIDDDVPPAPAGQESGMPISETAADLPIAPSGFTSDGLPPIAAFDAESPESHAWHIESAASHEQAAVIPDIWSTDAQDSDDTQPSTQPSADIWARTAVDIGSDDEVDDQIAPVSRIDSLAIEALDEDLPPIDLPSIGRAPDEWAWLFADGLPLLRTSRATGFPWVAGGIGEVATAIQSAVNLNGIANFEAEAEAWVRIARSIPYAELITGDDAQAFVEWCNSLSVDLAASNQQDALCQAISEAMYGLRGRARNDMETSLALPDAFDTSLPGGSFGRSLSA